MLPTKPIKFDAPACYRIIVERVLSEIHNLYFNGMKIVLNKCEDGIGRTTITGVVRDQAALAGILNMLYEFHCPILLVECVEEKISDEYNPN